MANEVKIVVTAQDRASGTLKKVSGSADQTSKSFLGINASALKAGLAIGGLTVAAGMAGRAILDMANLASNLEESQNKVGEVFKSSAFEVREFAETASDALRQTEQAALEAAGSFGNMFVSFGASRDLAAEMSINLVQLAADLGSFNNITDAADKLRAGLAGSSEVLLPLGIDIRAVTVEAKALELGLAATKGQLTELDRTTARYKLILEQTTDAQGDAARTADTFAGRTAELDAKFEELKTSIGENLTGPLLEATEAGLGLIGVLETIGGSRIGTEFGVFIDSFGRNFEQLDRFLQLDFSRPTPIDPFIGDFAFPGAQSNVGPGGSNAGFGSMRIPFEEIEDLNTLFDDTAGAADVLLAVFKEEQAAALAAGLETGSLGSAIDELADSLEKAARAAEDARREEQRLADARFRSQASNQALLIRAFLADPNAGQNLIPLINDPLNRIPGLPGPGTGPGSTGPIQIDITLDGQVFDDAVASSNQNHAATGQLLSD